MEWEIEYLPEAEAELRALDGSARKTITKAIEQVRKNPLPSTGDENGNCGLGKPLGNKMGYNLTGLLKIKPKGTGLRVVYKLIKEGSIMKILVIGLRSEAEVYKDAFERRTKHSL